MNDTSLDKKTLNQILINDNNLFSKSFIDINKDNSNIKKNENIIEEITSEEINEFIKENLSLFETDDSDLDINKTNNNFLCRKIKKIIYEEDEKENDIFNIDNFSFLTEKKINNLDDITEENLAKKLNEMKENNTLKPFLIKYNIKKDFKINKNISCKICYESNQKNEYLINKCGHILCKGCWNKCLQRKLQCPFCKKKVYKTRLIKLLI